MDDWSILAKTRWALKKAIRVMNAVLARLGFLKHPLKTWFGRLRGQGIECFGVRIRASGCELGRKCIERVTDTLARLLEQHATAKRVSQYLKHWGGWAKGHGIQVCDETKARLMCLARDR